MDLGFLQEEEYAEDDSWMLTADGRGTVFDACGDYGHNVRDCLYLPPTWEEREKEREGEKERRREGESETLRDDLRGGGWGALALWKTITRSVILPDPFDRSFMLFGTHCQVESLALTTVCVKRRCPKV